MILDELQTTLSNILPSTPVIAEFDATMPVAVYQAEPTPIRTKDGIIGYTQKVQIAIIDDDLDRMELNTIATRAAIEAMTGTSTGINMVIFDTETGPQFDRETATWQNTLDYTFDTNNR